MRTVYTQQKGKCYHDTDNTTTGREKEDNNQYKNVADEAANLKKQSSYIDIVQINIIASLKSGLPTSMGMD